MTRYIPAITIKLYSRDYSYNTIAVCILPSGIILLFSTVISSTTKCDHVSPRNPFSRSLHFFPEVYILMSFSGHAFLLDRKNSPPPSSLHAPMHAWLF